MGTKHAELSRHIPDNTRLMLAVVAGGRCEFAGCNDFLLEHHLTRHLGVFGQNAHIVAFGKAGPRASATSKSGKVHDIGNLKGPRHLSVFALAPIPVLVLFGAVLGNKVAADMYQRHRDTEAWCWKTDGEPVEYAFKKVKGGARGGAVAIVLSLSGKVPLEQVEARAGASVTVYEISLEGQKPRPSYLRLREDLARFATAYREALAVIRSEHVGLAELMVFPAVPAPVAVVMGRELLPKVDPVLLVHDFDKVNGFQQRVKVNAYDPE